MISENQKTIVLNSIKKDLDIVTEKILRIIHKYNLEVTNPLDVIKVAKSKINSNEDYVEFIELSLQGRLLSEAYDHLKNDEKSAANED